MLTTVRKRVVLGAVFAVAVSVMAVLAASRGDADTESTATLEAFHRTASIVEVGEQVRLLYDVICYDRTTAADPALLADECKLEGSVFIRQNGGAFAELPLQQLPKTPFLVVDVPERFAKSGTFSYYAVIDDQQSGKSVTTPPGGQQAPHTAWIVQNFKEIDLATEFDQARTPDQVVLAAPWGKDVNAVGLDAGLESSTIGPAAFDFTPDGELVVLDQINQRLLIDSGDAVREAVAITHSTALADLAIGPNGVAYVLDGSSSTPPVLRAFDLTGDVLGESPLAQRIPAKVRMSEDVPMVLQSPADMWLPVFADDRALSSSEQTADARMGKKAGQTAALLAPAAAEPEIIVSAFSYETRIAVVDGNRVVEAWRVKGDASLGEVQLAEPYRDELVLVLRMYTDTEAEFKVLRLGREGLRAEFAAAPAEWAETAVLSRFRLHGDGLYQARSDPDGYEIVVFDLEGGK